MVSSVSIIRQSHAIIFPESTVGLWLQTTNRSRVATFCNSEIEINQDSVADNRGVAFRDKQNSVDFSTSAGRGRGRYQSQSKWTLSKERIISRFSLWQLSQQVMANNVIPVEISYRRSPSSPLSESEIFFVLLAKTSGKMLGKRIDFLVGYVFPLIFSVPPRSPFFFLFFLLCSRLLFFFTFFFVPVTFGTFR